jgi:hypothetical protein
MPQPINSRANPVFPDSLTLRTPPFPAHLLSFPDSILGDALPPQNGPAAVLILDFGRGA